MKIKYYFSKDFQTEDKHEIESLRTHYYRNRKEDVIEKVTEMENILIEWNESIGYDTKIYELYDWETKLNTKGDKDSGMKFNDVYIFSDNNKSKYIKRLCYIKDKVAVSNNLVR